MEDYVPRGVIDGAYHIPTFLCTAYKGWTTLRFFTMQCLWLKSTAPASKIYFWLLGFTASTGKQYSFAEAILHG